MLSISRRIPGFHYYFINEKGEVWSEISRRYLKTMYLPQGYLYVNLGSQHHSKLIHRLVLETFVGPCPDGMECRHLDGNKLNNHVDNLKWGTHQENINDTIRHGTTGGLKTAGENHGKSKLTEQKVRTITYLYKTGEFTFQQLGDLYGVTNQTISSIIHKKVWKCVWRKYVC